MSKKVKRPNLDDVLRRLKSLIEEIRKDFDSPEPTTKMSGVRKLEADVRILFQADVGTIVLAGDRGMAYSAVILDLYNAVSRPDREISYSAVEAEVRDSVLRAVDPDNKNSTNSFPDRLETSVKSLRASLLQSARGWTVEIEVAGISLGSQPETFGAVEFYAPSWANTAVLRNRYAKMIDSTKNTDAEKQGVRDLYNRMIQERMIGRMFARVRASAVDNNAAEIVARRQLRRTLDVLNFFATIFENSRTGVYLSGDASPSITVTPMWSDGDDSIRVNQEWRGPLGTFSFNSVATELWKRAGAERASAVLANQKRTDLDERILTALEWAGRASVDGRIEESFMLFIISLETLLLSRGSADQIVYRFAVRGAHLLGGDVAARKALLDKFKRLYRLRSDVVHSGSTEVTESDRDNARFLARRAILAVLTDDRFRKMSTEAELEDWFEEQVISEKS